MKFVYQYLAPCIVIAIAGCNNGPTLNDHKAAAQKVLDRAANLRTAFLGTDPTVAPPSTITDEVKVLQKEIPVIQTALQRIDNAGTVTEDVPRIVEQLKQAGVETQIIAAATDVAPEPPPRDDDAVQAQADAGSLPDLPSPPLPPRDDSDVPAPAAFADAPVTPTVVAATIEIVQEAEDQLQQMEGEIADAGVPPLNLNIPPPPPPPTATMLAEVQHAKKEGAKFAAAGLNGKADITLIAAQALSQQANGGVTTRPAPTGNENTDLFGHLAAAVGARRKAIDPVDAAENPPTCQPDEWDESALCQ